MSRLKQCSAVSISRECYVFSNLSYPLTPLSCNALAIRPKPDGDPESHPGLLDLAEEYFTHACTDFHRKLRCTARPPMYFQQPGHSMTIIGLERKSDGSRNLLVFDPMFHDHSQMLKLAGKKITSHKATAERLKAYRRGVKYLKRYKEFEVLQ